MTTQVYLIMYLLLFVSAARLRRRRPEVQRGYRAPALVLQCVVGFVASAAAIVIGFFPPSQFGSGQAWQYVLLIATGVVGFGLLAPALFLLLRKPSWKTAEPLPGGVE
jgi:amino acid transporter